MEKNGMNAERRTSFFKKRRRPKSILRHASTLLQETTITGIVPILNSKGCFRKSVKLIILAFGMAGFLFQTYEFLTFYWQYSTITTIQNLEKMKKPAVTICDSNLMSRKYLCDNRPELCKDISSSFVYDEKVTRMCEIIPDYCPIPTFEQTEYYKVPKDFVVNYEESFFEWNYTRNSGFRIEESIASCTWFDTSLPQNHPASSMNCSKPKYIRGLSEENLPGACYTFESNVNGGTYEGKILKDEIILRMTLKWEASDYNNRIPDPTYTRKRDPRTYFLSFHHPGQLNNPFIQGISVKELKYYEVFVTETDFVRLVAPYSSNCYDYVKVWEKNGGKGPLNKEECQKKCEIDASFRAYGCVSREIEYPHEMKLCPSIKEFNMSLYLEIQHCLVQCREACFEIKYSASTEEVGEMAQEDAKAKYGTPTVVVLEVFFNIFDSKLSTATPKYESIELFSYIGGYLGMWLGWCILALCDFVEIIFSICEYSFVQKNKSSEKR